MAKLKHKDGNEDKNPNWGGKREGAGRPSKGELLKLKDLMDENIDPAFVVQKLFTLIDNGDFRAIDLYLKHRVGMPKQSVDVHSTGDMDLNFKLKNLISFKDDKPQSE